MVDTGSDPQGVPGGSDRAGDPLGDPVSGSGVPVDVRQLQGAPILIVHLIHVAAGGTHGAK